LLCKPPYIALNPRATKTFYHDVPDHLVSQYAPLLGKQPAATFTTPVAHAGWRAAAVPSTYVYTRQDRPLPLPYQQFMVRRAQEEAAAGRDGGVRPFGGAMGEVYVDAGHTPFLSATREMGDILVRAAEVVE